MKNKDLQSKKGFRKNLIAASVSTLALSAGAMAQDTTPNIVFDLTLPDVLLTEFHESVSNVQLALSSSADSTNAAAVEGVFSVPMASGSYIWLPSVTGPGSVYPVINNGIIADANISDTTNTLNLSVVDAADPAMGNPIAAGLVVNLQGADDASSSSATNRTGSHPDTAEAADDAVQSEILVTLDFPVGADNNSVDLSGNLIAASAGGNVAVNTATGKVDPNFASREQGQVKLPGEALPPPAPLTSSDLEVSGSYAVASVQLNAAGSVAALNDQTRVGFSGTATGGSINSLALDVDGNAIAAGTMGNDATNGIAIEDGGNLEFAGSATVANMQGDGNATTDARTATNRNALIEIGDSEGDANVGTPVYVGSLTTDNSVNFTDNSIAAAATSNRAGNTITLSGVDQVGNAPDGAGLGPNGDGNTAAFNGTDVVVTGDLVIGSGQYSAADNQTQNDGASGFNVLLSDVQGATSVNVDGNSSSTVASGNVVGNNITVETGAELGVTPDLDSVSAINSTQYKQGDGANTNDDTSEVRSLNQANLRVDLTEADTDAFNQDSRLDVTNNSASADAYGNVQGSSTDIEGFTVTGVDVDVAGVVIDRTTTSASARANHSVLSTQVVDQAEVRAVSNATMAVTADGAGGFDAADPAAAAIDNVVINTSDNDVSATAVGNYSDETKVNIDANTFQGTVAVGHSQTVEDGSVIAASSSTGTDTISVEVISADLRDVVVTTDGNSVSGQAFANLADASTNAISVSATSIVDGTDNGAAGGVTVDRDPSVSSTTADGGFVLLNDQSVEDLGADSISVSLDADGDFVRTDVIDRGAGEGGIVGGSFSTSDNSVRGAAAANQATNRVDLAAGTLDGSTALANVQSVDSENTAESAEVQVDISRSGIAMVAVPADEFDSDTPVDAGGIDGGRYNVDGNLIAGSASGNGAGNTITVAAAEQTVTAADDDGTYSNLDLRDGVGAPGVVGTTANAEITLANDQVLVDLAGDGVSSEVQSDITLEVNSTLDSYGATEGADIGGGAALSISGNTIQSAASGNSAGNTVDIDVDQVVLNGVNGPEDEAGGSNTAGNGPYATIASNQVVDVDVNVGVQASATDSAIHMSIRNMDDITNSASNGPVALTADDNLVLAAAQANAVNNVLTADGVAFINPVVNSAPLITTSGTAVSLADSGIQVDNGGIAVGSRQYNDGAAYAEVMNNPGVAIETGQVAGAGTFDDVNGAILSVSDNALVASAGGNDAGNRLATDYDSNHTQSSVANLQINDGIEENQIIAEISDGNARQQGAPYDTNVGNTGMPHFIVELGDEATDLVNDGAIINVDDNTMLAQANANSAANSLSAEGALIASGTEISTDVLPAGVVELRGHVGPTDAGDLPPNIGPETSLRADQGLVNRQYNNMEVSATVNEAFTGFSVRTVEDATLTADGNTIAAQGTMNVVDNSVALAGGTIGLAGDSPTAGIVSEQIAGGTVSANVLSPVIGTAGADPYAVSADLFAAPIADLDSELAAAISVSQNTIMAATTVQAASNAVSAIASGAIVGDGASSAASVSAAGDLDVFGDYAVINAQASDANSYANVFQSPSGETAGPEDDDEDPVNGAQFEPNIGPRIGVTSLTGTVNDNVVVEDNVIDADAQGNVATNSITLDGNSVSASQQLINNQSNTGETAATIDNADVVIEVGDGTTAVDSGVINVSGNEVSASGTGNSASNSAGATSDTSITGQVTDPVTDINLTDDGLGDDGVADGLPEVSAGADVALINRQDLANDVENSVTNTEIRATLLGAVLDSNVDVNDNLISATSGGNAASNDTFSNAGTSNTGTVASASLQTAAPADEGISAFIDNSFIGVDQAGDASGEGIVRSTMNVDGNSMQASATANSVENTMSHTAGTALGTGRDGGAAEANPVDSIAGKDATMLNGQLVTGGETRANIYGSDIGIEAFEEDEAAFTAVNDSALSVSDNAMAAAATANAASNTLEQAAGTSAYPSSALVNGQVMDQHTVFASADEGISIGVNSGQVTDSAISVERNDIDVVARGNVNSSNQSATAGTSLDGADDPVAGGTPLAYLNAPETIVFDQQAYGRADVVQINGQEIYADGQEVRAQSGGVQMGLDADGISGSNVDVDDNDLSVQALGNLGSGNVDLAAGTSNDATAVLISTQLGVGEGDDGLTVVADVFSTTISAETFVTDITRSSVDVTGNDVVGLAQTNSVANTLTYGAGTEIGAANAFAPPFTVNLTLAPPLNPAGGVAGLVVGGGGNAALVSSQEQEFNTTGASVEQTDILVDVEDGGIYDSSIEVSDNSAVAAATGSTGANALEFDAGSSSQAGGAVVSHQQADSSVATAGNSVATIGAYTANAAIEDSSVDVNDNVVASSAQLQSVSNALASTAGTSLDTNGLPPISGVVGTPTLQGSTADNMLVNSQAAVDGAAGAETIEVAIGAAVGYDNDGEDIDDSNVGVEGNVVSAAAGISAADNSIALKSGSTTSSSAALVNSQQRIGAYDFDQNGDPIGNVSTASVEDVWIGTWSDEIEQVLDSGIGSSVSVDANALLATAKGNEASNSASVDAGTSIEVVSGITGIGVGSGAAYLELDLPPEFGALLNNQGTSVSSVQLNSGLTQATIGGSEDGSVMIAAETESQVQLSDVSVSGNTLQAAATGNQVGNTVALKAGDNVGNSDAEAASSAGINNLQFGDNPFSELNGTVETNAGIGFVQLGQVAYGGEIELSSIDVDTNTLLATATTNDGTNRLSVDAGTAIIGQGFNYNLEGNSGNFAPVTYGALSVGTDAIINQQITAGADSNAGIGQVEMGSFTSERVFDSSISVDSNALNAAATGNRSVNSLAQKAGSSITAPGAGLINAQDGVDSDTTAAALGISIAIDVGFDITGSATSVDGNSVLATARTNVATNSMAVNAGTSISGADFVPDEILDIDAAVNPNPLDPTVVNLVADEWISFQIETNTGSVADVALFNVQSVGGDPEVLTESRATITGVQIFTDADDQVTDSNVTVDANQVVGQSAGNTATSSAVINSGDAQSATGTVSSWQLAGDHRATTAVSAVDVGVEVDDSTTDSEVSASGNAVAALSGLSSAGNSLDADAGTTMSNVDGATALLSLDQFDQIAGYLELGTSADMSVLNVQEAYDSQASSSLGDVRVGAALNGAVDGSNVNVDDNLLLASAYSNDAANALSLSNGSGLNTDGSVQNLQVSSNTSVSSTIGGATIGINGVQSADRSSFSVSGNTVRATSVVNRSSNLISN